MGIVVNGYVIEIAQTWLYRGRDAPRTSSVVVWKRLVVVARFRFTIGDDASYRRAVTRAVAWARQQPDPYEVTQ